MDNWHLVTVLIVITIVSPSQSQDRGVNGDGGLIPQCNHTCRYIAWAYDANCRDRSLVTVPLECREAKTMDLRDNKITRATSNMFLPFRNLLYVDLEYNNMIELAADAFVDNDRVRHIYLQSNRLEVIRKDTFTGVPNLIQLYLNSNQITTIEMGAFAGLSKLEMLFLSENKIEDIPVGILSGLSKLRYFHMTHNRLTILRNDTFKNLVALRHLNFINNNIRVIEAGAFKSLSSLQSLRLAYNDISVIGYRAFSRLRGLIRLDLYGNKIATVSNFTTTLMKNVDEVFLGGNPLMCDCQMTALRSWYRRHEITDSKANATCAGPEDVRGVAVIDVETLCSPVPPEKETEHVFLEEEIPEPAKRGRQDNVQSSYHEQYPSSTIIIIAIVCVLLFAVGFVGVVCLIYDKFYRKPFNHKQYYKQISQISRTESNASDDGEKGSNMSITVNPCA